MTPLTDEEILHRAKQRVEAKLGFYTHALVYGLVNLGLAVLSSVQGGPRWHLWTLAGWGLGLAIHGIVVFAKLNGDGLRERMLAAETEKLRRLGR